MILETIGNISGLLAAICVGTFLVPQCIKTFKSKHVEDISVWMITIGLLGDIFVIIHMCLVLPFNWMLWLKAVFVTFFGIILLVMYVMYKKPKDTNVNVNKQRK